jgi:hypothetical protein
MTWRLPDTYHSAGTRRGTATLKFYEGRDILHAVREVLAYEHELVVVEASTREIDASDHWHASISIIIPNDGTSVRLRDGALFVSGNVAEADQGPFSHR